MAIQDRTSYRIQHSATLPASCNPGDVYIDDSGGAVGLYVCIVANTWVGPFVTATTPALSKCIISEQMGTGTACTIAAGQTNYVSAFGGGATGTSATESPKQVHMPFAGTMRNLRVWTQTAQPAAGSLVITVRKEGAGTALTTTIAANAGAGLYTDLTNSVAFAAGDKFALQVVNNDGATTSAQIASFSIEYDSP